MTEQELYDFLFDRLCDSKDAHYEAAARGDYSVKFYQPEAYAELTKDIGPRLKAGTTVRIVFVSNMGDFGCTGDLRKCNYDFRVSPGDGVLTNCRLER